MLWENRRPDADQPTFPGDHVDALLEELSHLVLRLHDLQRRLPLPLVEPAQFFSSVRSCSELQIKKIPYQLKAASILPEVNQLLRGEKIYTCVVFKFQNVCNYQKHCAFIDWIVFENPVILIF